VQIATDGRKMLDYSHTLLAQVGLFANARKHQQLRGLEDPGAQKDFAVRAHALDLPALNVFDTGRPAALEQQPGRVGFGFNVKIGSRFEVREQVGPRRAASFAIAMRGLVNPDAFLLLTIEVIADRESGLARGVQEDVADRIVRLRYADAEWPTFAVVLTVKI